MKAVILVGGEGTRLKPLTLGTPKPVVPVANRPFLAHVIAMLGRAGVDGVVLATGYLPEVIEGRLRQGGDNGVQLTYSVEEAPLGTAVFLDGRSLGPAPVDPQLVPQGSHTVRALPPGGTPWEGSVTVLSMQRAVLRIP